MLLKKEQIVHLLGLYGASLLLRWCSMCLWSFQAACQEFGASPSKLWAYRTVWRFNWSLSAHVTAISLLWQTAASASTAKGLSIVACACVSRGSWERSVNVMRRVHC